MGHKVERRAGKPRRSVAADAVGDETKYKMFIVTSGGFYGYYGKGFTLIEAQAAWKKAGGKKTDGNHRLEVFASNLPFAPFDRKATEQEADAWVTQDGGCAWIRCTKILDELIEPNVPKKAKA